MDAMDARVGQGRHAVGPTHQRSLFWRVFLRFWWVGILVLLIVVAVWGGRGTSAVGAASSGRVATSSSIAVSATPAHAAAVSAATPAAQDNSAWYLYQQSHEGDYCQCNK